MVITSSANFSKRISEILSMPTPKRKLQPLLKPILKRRPKAAFKQRTMIEVMSMDDVNFRKPKQTTLSLQQMLGTNTEPESASSTTALVEKLRVRVMPPALISLPGTLVPEPSPVTLTLRNNRIPIPMILQREQFNPLPHEVEHDLQIEDHEVPGVSGIPNRKNGDPIIIPVISAESLSTESLRSSKKSMFTLLPMSRKFTDLTITQNSKTCVSKTGSEQSADSSSKSLKIKTKTKIRSRIFTLLELIARREKFSYSKSNSKVTNEYLQSPEKDPDTDCDNTTQPKIPNFSKEGKMWAYSPKATFVERTELSDNNSRIEIEKNNEDGQFNLNVENSVYWRRLKKSKRKLKIRGQSKNKQKSHRSQKLQNDF